MLGLCWLPQPLRLRDQFYKFFIPSAEQMDHTASNKAHVFLASHLLGPFLGGTVPLALYAFDPTPGYDILVLAASIASFWIFPFLLRWGSPLPRLILISLAVDNFAILWSCFHYGGVASPTLIWMLIIPILAVFYIGSDKKLQQQVAAVSVASATLFFLAYFILKPAPPDIPSAALLGLGAISTVAVLCYVAFMAIYYARIFDAGAELEKEVKRRNGMAIELRAAVASANRASVAKSEFLARMSHELRNPLNSIIGYGQLLREELEEAQDHQALKDISLVVDAGEYLIRMVTMILDLSKIEAGRMLFNLQKHSLKAILLDAVDRHHGPITAASNRIALRLCPNLGFATLDETRVHEVLDSVFKNAAQHTQGGLITIVANRDDDAGTYSVAVSDTGCGMTPEVLSSVFDSFSAPREAADSRYGGTGLNLVVSSRVCAAMGGKITAVSAIGQGSTFTITLPIEPKGNRVVAITEAAGVSAAMAAAA